MKSNYKLIAFIVLIILVILLYFQGQSEKNRADQAERGRDAAITMSNGWQKMSTVYKNKFGDQVIRTRAIEVDKSNIEALSKSKELQWLKKFEGLKTLSSNLQSGETFTTAFIAKDVPETIKYLPCKNDSLKLKSFDITDQWNNIHVLMTDSSKLEMRDKYYGVIELKHIKGWFWKGLIHLGWGNTWEPISELTNSNKLIKIDSIAVFVVKR